MIQCESIARKWGNSIGLTLPKEIVKKIRLKENDKVSFVILENDSPVQATFGILKGWKKPTKRILEEMRVGSWDG